MPYDSPIGILYLFAIVFSVLLLRHRSKKGRKYNGKKIEDTNEVIIRHRSKKDRKYNDKKIEDTNGGIMRHRSKKDRKYNDHFAFVFSVLLSSMPYDSRIGILYLFAIVFSVLF
jgi:hypothetical protein